MSRTASYNAADLVATIGPLGSTEITSANRALVQNWLVAQGVPSIRAKGMKLATLWKCYNKPRYLAAVLAHLNDASGGVASGVPTADILDVAADLATSEEETATPLFASAPVPVAPRDHIPPRPLLGDGEETGRAIYGADPQGDPASAAGAIADARYRDWRAERDGKRCVAHDHLPPPAFALSADPGRASAPRQRALPVRDPVLSCALDMLRGLADEFGELFPDEFASVKAFLSRNANS